MRAALTYCQHTCLFFMLSILLLLLSACSSNAGILGSGTWQASGLQRQHIRALAVNSNDPKTLYAGDAQGNVFVSTDAAQNWKEQSTGLPLPNPIHALAFDGSSKKL